MNCKRILWQSHDKKECESCGHILELKQFYPTISKMGKKYYSRKCRKCTREYLLSKVGEKTCKCCGETKPFQSFRPNKESYDTLCKVCRNEVSMWKYYNDKKWSDAHKLSTSKSSKKHREKRTEAYRNWKQNNPDRVELTRKNYLPKHRENCKKYIHNNKDRVYEKNREWSKNIRIDVDEKYIKYIYRNEGLADAPFYLIKLRKLQIIAKRKIKQKQNESQRTAQSNV